MKASVLALVALVVGLVPAVAHAGTYDVQLCADPQATGFVVRNDNPGVLTTTSVCPSVAADPFSGMFAGVKVGAGSMPRGTTASWTVTAPAGTSLEALTVRRRLAKSDSNYEVAVVKADGSIPDGCLVNDTCGEGVSTRTYGRTGAVTFRVSCAAGTCGTSTQGSRAWITVESARATIDDPAAPVILPSATADAWQRTPTVSVTATDAGGIASIALRNGEQPVGSQSLVCDYRHLQPCPGTGTGTFTLDVADGIHTLTALATDAAGQVATAAFGTLKLDRVAPAAPEGLTVQSAGAGRYLYTWRNPDQGAAAPIAAAHLSDGTVVKGTGITQVESASSSERIHLEDAAGNADPETAIGVGSNRTLPLNPPILQDSAPRIRLSSARRSGKRLIVKGSVANATSAKVTATVTRGAHKARKSAGVKKGRFTITLSLSSTMRRKGTVTLTVKHADAKATKRLRF